jgi:hypothetical protein
MPETPRGKPSTRAGAGRDAELDGDTLGRLQVRYYRRMRLQRVYAVVASWADAEGKRPGAAPVTLRLLMAGAQIVPAEHTLDPSDPDATATFYVTPLAKGWLRNERLEVLVGDRKVQEMPLPAKVTSQGLTLTLLLLAFLLPWFMLSYGKYTPLEMSRADIDPKKFESGKFDLDAGILVDLDVKGERKEFRIRERITKTDILAGTVPLEKLKRIRPDLVNKQSGEILAERIARETPEPPDFAKDAWKTVRGKIGDLYDNVLQWNRDYPIAFFLFVGFLLLALLSFILNHDRRRKRLSKPIPLPRAAADFAPARREELAAVEVD